MVKSSNKNPGVNVVRHGDDWVVRRDGGQRASRIFDTQREAIDYGRPIARRDETELRIQDVNARWRDSDSYCPDPAPPIDKSH